MLYADFTLEILPDGTIYLDKEITERDFPKIKDGDQYTFMIHNGQIVLKKNFVQHES